MDTTDVLSNYFMTVDMHKFDLMWLIYSRNKFFRVGPNISEKFVPGGTNFRGVQIKRDRPRGARSRRTELEVQSFETHSPRQVPVVSEPDPRKIGKEGLAYRQGWKCTLRPV